VTASQPARRALERGDHAGAAQSAQELIRTGPGRAEGYFVLAMVAAESGHFGKALPLLEQALACGPDAEHLAQYARVLITLRRDGDAADAARRALDLAPTDARTLDTLGCVLARLGDHEASVAPFERAVSADPDNLGYRYNLAAACGFTGRTAQAGRHYEEILARDPDDARTHYALAISARQTAESNHLERLGAALSRASAPGDRLRLSYASAKECEDLGDTASAYRHLSAANADHKRTLGYDFAQDAAIFDAIETAFADHAGTGALPASPSEGAAPIFVVGMPRTGTTLVDRILSSHPEVESAGELQAMPLAIKLLAGTPSRQVIDPPTAAAAMRADPAEIARIYLARAAPHRQTGSARFVDKLPANFLNVGHILRSVPGAAVVCLRRHPLDTVWSNYKNLFASQSAYYAYSYDLMDIARYYARFDRLMRVWQQLFPGRILELSYEELVRNQEPETRRLLSHCRLSWDPACLSFEQNRAAVATPSASQVRRPLNADAVGRWKAHAEALGPVREWFAARGLPVD
jgi:tetratricopeptide (TPR) repeat protein